MKGGGAAGVRDGRFCRQRPRACPPVVEYSSEFEARAAEELALLPWGSAVAKMLSDYAVMRAQARACS